MAPSSAGSRKRSRSRSGSASAIVADCASGYHDLKIDGYSRTKSLANGEALKSCPFTAGGYSWRIFYYPGGQTPGCADYVSLFLRLDEDVPAAVMAQYQFRFLGDVGEQAPPLTMTRSNKFTSWKGWGLCKFITREELERSVHLKDDAFTVRCDIVVTKEFRSEETTTTPSEESCFVAVPPPDLQRHLGDLLHSEKGADVVFEAGGETFAAHWCVLAARSPVFGAELFGSMKESDATAGVVRIDDMEAQVFKALLRFAYTDSLPEMEKKDEGAMCQHLLVAADRYAMERLKLVCEEKLCEHIDVSSVATILALAEQHHCDGLRNACFDFLSSPENLKAAKAGDGFEHLSKSCPSLLKELIAMLGNFVP